MPRPVRPWFRFYCEATRDPKLRRLTPAQRWLWVAVLSAARDSPESGYLYIGPNVPMTVDDLADYAGMRRADVLGGMSKLIQLGIVSVSTETGVWHVPAFRSRQYESDDVTARTRKHKALRAGRNDVGTPLERSNENRRNDVTESLERSGNGSETETETETELLTGNAVDNVVVEFARWWEKYPRKVNRAAALKAYRARIRDGHSPAELLEARDQYRAARHGQDPQYTMHGSTFLAPDGPWTEWVDGRPADSIGNAELTSRTHLAVVPTDSAAGYWLPATAAMCPTCESSLLACNCDREVIK